MRTRLVTDRAGAEMLIQGIGLQFDDVVVDLDLLEGHDPDWWVLGKLHTYRTQTEPFVHLDNDVYLWHPLPEAILNAPVLAQNPEHFTDQSDYYYLRDFEVLREAPFGWLPKEWQWGVFLFGSHQMSVNTGIYGGHHLGFIRYCAELAFELIEHLGNQEAVAALQNKIKLSGILEMYLPAVCSEYHNTRACSPFRGVEIRTLFESAEKAYRAEPNTSYTHLIGLSKQRPRILRRLEDRMRREHPDLYGRCLDYARLVGELPDVTGLQDAIS